MTHNVALYLIRHTEPLIETGTCYGQLDCAVTDDYPSQSSNILAYFNNKTISTIYSSPLRRCAQLAEDLADQHSATEVIYEDAFKEINFGDWEGMKWDDIGRAQIELWNENRLHFEFPNGECPDLFRRRVLSTYARLQSSSQSAADSAIVLVTHAGVIRTILSEILNLSFSDSLNLPVEKASISLITCKKEIQQVTFMNYLP